jgi:acyl-CoA synthetase (NDP forming)
MHNVKKYNFVVQEMIKGQEIIMGIKRDEIFGPVILFGLGGVLVEILKDVSMRIAPLSKRDCKEMIEEIKGSKLLDGYRNIKKVNKEKIIELLLNLSDLAVNEKEIEEIDFNPVIVNEKNAVVVDARIIMKV